MNNHVPVERFDKYFPVSWDRRTRRHVSLNLLNHPSYAVFIGGPNLGQPFDHKRFRNVFLEQLLDLPPVGTNSHSQGSWHGENLAVPAWNGRCRVVNRQNVHFSIVSDLLHLPDPTLDDKIQPDAGLCHHELLAQYADGLLC